MLPLVWLSFLVVLSELLPVLLIPLGEILIFSYAGTPEFPLTLVAGLIIILYPCVQRRLPERRQRRERPELIRILDNAVSHRAAL